MGIHFLNTPKVVRCKLQSITCRNIYHTQRNRNIPINRVVVTGQLKNKSTWSNSNFGAGQLILGQPLGESKLIPSIGHQLKYEWRGEGGWWWLVFDSKHVKLVIHVCACIRATQVLQFQLGSTNTIKCTKNRGVGATNTRNKVVLT